MPHDSSEQVKIAPKLEKLFFFVCLFFSLLPLTRTLLDLEKFGLCSAHIKWPHCLKGSRKCTLQHHAIHFSAILSGRTKPDISYAKVEHVANRNNRTKNDTFPTSCKDEQFTVNIHWAVVIYSVDMEFLALSRISATCLSSEHSSVSTMKSLCK